MIEEEINQLIIKASELIVEAKKLLDAVYHLKQAVENGQKRKTDNS